ncbi:hypothetical protein CY34DRAFT_399359 [Suillus luteus UH-Slu-Lm8-n1]|uniref:Uncharacterized protein n=1 Tax=Suillus luteus UH-Slu-Lm8-n1 TaxID=930992 RepID=A0A0D0B302_9AGAM|nr:hypothetical protein CY34DRAFT_399359 [Suillus luteus UH-Slu-Lm8-n1]
MSQTNERLEVPRTTEENKKRRHADASSSRSKACKGYTNQLQGQVTGTLLVDMEVHPQLPDSHTAHHHSLGHLPLRTYTPGSMLSSHNA